MKNKVDKIVNSVKQNKNEKEGMNMDAKAKAEEFFETIVTRKKSLVEIPRNCSQGETGALLYLTFVKDGITSSELAEILNVSLPRVASLLNSLESKNLVKRLTDREDKRKTIVNITDVGKEIVLNKKEEAINRIAEVIEKLSEEDINEYIRLAKKISTIMDEMQD